MLSTSTSLSRSRSSGSKKNRGFTLVELLVVVSIMLIITSTLLLQQQKFNSATLMRTLAYNIALSIRQAQVYGTSVVGTTTSTGLVYASGYGVLVNTTPDRYRLFADLNGNSGYNSGEQQQLYILSSGHTINDFCVIAGGSYYCKNSGGSGQITNITIVFKRPNPDALIKASGFSGAISAATVQIMGPGGTWRAVQVTTTGQITVCGVNLPQPYC